MDECGICESVADGLKCLNKNTLDSNITVHCGGWLCKTFSHCSKIMNDCCGPHLMIIAV